ncbi:hypothetical protein B0H16DRAFT_1728875 [Mycena metata]|uniref:Uncharacterized protein n=1 Tax=Mycena metata TaxID=1033252 RepID=A0AAD7N104_9AGAR|nr:hypothetical protein B0H16DRAFT_1728875 [Mycena metata]
MGGCLDHAVTGAVSSSQAVGLPLLNCRHDDNEEQRQDAIRPEINAELRFDSFAAERSDMLLNGALHIDGHDYIWALSEIMDNARAVIFIQVGLRVFDLVWGVERYRTKKMKNRGWAFLCGHGLEGGRWIGAFGVPALHGDGLAVHAPSRIGRGFRARMTSALAIQCAWGLVYRWARGDDLA